MPLVYTDIQGSTAIQRIGFDTVTSALTIVFVGKTPPYPEYVWGGVESELIKAFFLAPSKGKFYHRFLKGNPRYTIQPVNGSYRISALGRKVSKGIKKAIRRAARVPR